MGSSVLRLIGLLFFFGAVAVAILNLEWVANLGLPWFVPLCPMVIGAALVLLAKRSKE